MSVKIHIVGNLGQVLSKSVYILPEWAFVVPWSNNSRQDQHPAFNNDVAFIYQWGLMHILDLLPELVTLFCLI